MTNRHANTRIVSALCLIFLAFALSFGQDRPVPVPNPDFDRLSAGSLPVDWQIETGGGDSSPVQVGLDQGALLIDNRDFKSVTVVSAPVSLQVGRLYRLSCSIKTEGVESDPLDRYPTSAAACLTMASFPFTNHSPTVGGDTDFKEVSVLFLATGPTDRVRLHLGLNGKARGKAWFDRVRLEEVSDITAYIPMETVRWFGPAFRYEDRGWIFVHIEGRPYDRGYQYGYLLADEMAAYIRKLAVRESLADPVRGWLTLRRFADATMLRKYDPEYLEEMKGIADGAAKNGAQFNNVPLDLIDIVTMNSAVDIGQVDSALAHTAHGLSGRNFFKAEDEMAAIPREHKCSSFLANGPATPQGEIVFGQIFMWSGYTGVHWNVICDVIPEKGHRLVYETFPGGIHSGADFYINDAGIMIGETTVVQTPLNIAGSPQSNRIRKAAQYAGSIAEVVNILEKDNNGLYTNDWLIGDAKTNETAIFLLGTHKSKLWSSKQGSFPGGTGGFLWSTNNAKDPEVRKEYIPQPTNAPFDINFSANNRDIAFYRFYQQFKGRIDAIAAVNLWASSPINRPHACDGKITTTAMAREMVFMAHFGKVTLREKFPQKDSRLMPDLPEASPHLTLGYSVFSPKFVVEKLQALKKAGKEKSEETKPAPDDYSQIQEVYTFTPDLLWYNTVFPATTRENWFISGTAAYWALLKPLTADPGAGAANFINSLADLNHRLLYLMSREEPVIPLEAGVRYDVYSHYQVPRIKGTFLLHQLRLCLGNEHFSEFMNQVHDRFREKPLTHEDLIKMAEKVAGKSLRAFFYQWLSRADIPCPVINAQSKKTGQGWDIELTVKQPANPFHFFTTVAVKTREKTFRHKVEVLDKAAQSLLIQVPAEPVELVFNAGNDIPVPRENFYTWANFFDDFHHGLILYGTSRQIEANHTLALQFQSVLADRHSEILPPVRKESEATRSELTQSDLIVLHGAEDNGMVASLLGHSGLTLGKNMFSWQGKTYAGADDGIFLALPNPYNPNRAAYIFIANSALQLYYMTRQHYTLPGWALFKKTDIKEQGYHAPASLTWIFRP